MEATSGAEIFVRQNYADRPLRWYVIDIWDGTAEQCAVFELATNLSEPMIMNGGRTSGVARSFGASIEHYFVIDGDGIIRYERSRLGAGLDGQPLWQPDAIAQTIDAALAALPAEARAFGAVKALFR